MTTDIRHSLASVIRFLGVCITLLVFQGCGNDGSRDILQINDGEKTIQLGFRLRLDKQYAGTRRSLPANYPDPPEFQQGTLYENYVGISKYDYSFLLFDGDGKYIQTLTVLSIREANVSDNYTDYRVLSVMTEKPDGEFKIVALANWGVGNYPSEPELKKGVTTIDDVCSKGIYSYAPGANTVFVPSEQTPIPMYGINTYNIDLKPDVVNEVGLFYLLRAMAKVTVRCSQSNVSEPIELASVKMVGYNTQGYCAPEGMDTSTDYVTSVHIPAEEGVTNTGELNFSISDDKQSAVIYVPEYLNSNITACTPCKLLVSFTTNPESYYTIEFKTYESGKPTDQTLDVLRNVLYCFTVSKYTVDFAVTLQPYNIAILNPDFGLEISD